MALLDAFSTFKFLKLLSQKWEETDAFKHGIIDKDGNPLRKQKELKTRDEKEAYTRFTIMVFNIKRLIEKLPFGKARISSLATALFLLKEEYGMVDSKPIEQAVWKHLKESGLQPVSLAEHVECEGILEEGKYISLNETLTTDGEVVEKSEILVTEDLQPVAKVLGTNVYQLRTKKGNKDVLLTLEDVRKL